MAAPVNPGRARSLELPERDAAGEGRVFPGFGARGDDPGAGAGCARSQGAIRAFGALLPRINVLCLPLPAQTSPSPPPEREGHG